MTENLEFEMIDRFFVMSHIEEVQDGEHRFKKRFNPPSWYCGGPVPGNLLYRPENVELLKIELIPAIDVAYASIDRLKMARDTKYDNSRFVTKVIHACERRRIPQNFAPGIFLMYLELCVKCDWWHLLPSILDEKRKALESKKVEVDWTENMVEQVSNLAVMKKHR